MVANVEIPVLLFRFFLPENEVTIRSTHRQREWLGVLDLRALKLMWPWLCGLDVQPFAGACMCFLLGTGSVERDGGPSVGLCGRGGIGETGEQSYSGASAHHFDDVSFLNRSCLRLSTVVTYWQLRPLPTPQFTGLRTGPCIDPGCTLRVFLLRTLAGLC